MSWQDPPVVLIVGSGLLAHELDTVFNANAWRTVVRSRSTRESLDITQPMHTWQRWRRSRLIVNAAGYTNVDAAEQASHEAFRINALGAESVARVAAEMKIPLVHISTDAVFHDEVGARRAELDTPCPASVYGRSKLLGERLAVQACPETMIVRLANLYGVRGKNWASRLRHRVQRMEEVAADGRREVAPTWARWAAETIFALAVTKKLSGGLYHACPKGLTTWRGFADEMARHLGLTINRVHTAEISYEAPRGRIGALDSCMLPLRGIDIPTWEELLCRYLNEEPAGDRSVVEPNAV